jgi:hypothetical protein
MSYSRAPGHPADQAAAAARRRCRLPRRRLGYAPARMARAADPLPRVSAIQARRLLLAGQGLLEAPVRATAESVYRVVEQLGFVQIDSINVVERAHHLILAA